MPDQPITLTSALSHHPIVPEQGSSRVWGLPSNWGRWLRRITPVVLTPLIFGFAPHIYNNLVFLTTMVVYVVLAEGVNLLYGFTGYLPFGYVGFFGAGAYGAALSLLYWHVPGLVAVLIGGLAASLIGLLLSPLLRLSGAYFAMATLAASQVLYYIVVNEPWTFGSSGVSLPQVFSNTQIYLLALVVMAIAIATTVFIRESRFGLSLMAIRSDPVSAAMAGINVVKARTLAWFISAAMAGLAGAVWAIMTAFFYAEYPFDLTISVLAIVFAMFGGVRTVLGPVVGAVLLYSFHQYIGVSNPQYFQLLYGALIVVLVLFLPGGLSSLVGSPGNRPKWWRFLTSRGTAIPTSRTGAVSTVERDAEITSSAGKLHPERVDNDDE